MRIDEIAVDGFGLLHGYSVSPAPGLTVFRGENEAGKTTLMAFIRAMLFGFESRAYPPLAGGRRGGRLTVSMADGTIVRIERYGGFETGGRGQLRVRDGRDVELDASAVDRLLQGIDRGVFANVFAFGLAELASFETLRGADLSSRIYSAGLGTGGVSVLEVERALQGELEALFRSGGANPRINQLLSGLEEVEERLAGLDLPAAYGEAQRRLRELDERLDLLRREDERLGTEERRLERIVRGWPAWLALRAARDELAALPEAAVLPADARDRLARLEEAREAAAERHEHATRLAAQARQAAEAIVVDERLVEARDAIAPMLEADREARARNRELEELRRERAAARSRMDERLERLGTGWDRERLLAFDDSVATHAAIGRHRRAIELAMQSAGEARARLAAAERDLDAVEGEIADVRQRIEALGAEATPSGGGAGVGVPGGSVPAPTAPAVDERIAGTAVRTPGGDTEVGETERAEPMASEESASPVTRTMTAAGAAESVADRDRIVRRIEAALVRRDSLSAAAAALEADLAATPRAVSSAVVVALAGAVMLSGLAVSALLLAAGTGPAPAGVAVALGLVGAALVVLVGRRPGRAGGDAGRTTRIADLRKQTADLDGLIAGLASSLGIPSPPDAEHLDQARLQVERERNREAVRIGLESQHEALIDRRSRVEAQVAAARAATVEADDALEAARDGWAAWLAERGLDRSLDPEAAARVVESVGNAREQVRSLAAIEARITECEAEEATRAAHAASVLASIGRSVDGTGGLHGSLAVLRADFERALTADAERRLARERADQLAQELHEAEDHVRSLAEAWRTFLGSCGAEDADAVRRALDDNGRRAALGERVAAQMAALTALSGPDAALERFLAELGEVADIEDVRSRLATVSEERETVHRDRTGIDREFGALRDNVSRWERAVEATVDRQRRADLSSTLRSEADRWAVRALALAVLHRTREQYEREHRPDVLRVAEQLIADWSARRYVRIVAPLGGQVEGLERSDGTQVTLAGLSTGTAQQLYLALRFGLAEHLATVGEALPIVMDDILVNFDELRARRAAHSIEDLATRHQVLYFTCHADTPLHADLEVPLAPLVQAPATA